jgi:putative heme-binding domain-containing protein
MNTFLRGLADGSASAALSAPGGAASEAAGCCDSRTAALSRAWAISQFTEARTLQRRFFDHADEYVRHVGAIVAGIYRDKESLAQLLQLLDRGTAANRRAAAEALGRIGDRSAVPHLLAAAAEADDRILQHSITYALIELNDAAATQAGLASDEPRTVGAALLALDQMPDGGVAPGQVVSLLNSRDAGLRDTARWIVTQHSEWGGELADWFRGQLAYLPKRSSSDTQQPADDGVLESMLVAFAPHAAIQQLLAETMGDARSNMAARAMTLRVVSRAKLSQPPREWRSALADVIADGQPQLLTLAVAAARAMPASDVSDALDRALARVAASAESPRELRVAALAVAAGSLTELSRSQFELLLTALSAENPVPLRSAAADAISRARLSPSQLGELCEAVESAGPLEIARLLAPFKKSTDQQLGMRLLAALRKSSAVGSLRIDVVRETLAGHGQEIQSRIDELEALVNVDAATQRRRIEELLPQMSQGDIRRGHAVYYSSKAACSACHRLGHAGETIGPELTRIGETRTERDLLESILYPSLSFVRSYEPVLVITIDGRTINGAIRDENAQELILTVGADQEVRVPREEIEEMLPSKVSIMPTGLDAQLTTQELADLVAFLKNATGQ